jgi:hypothetical protein
MGQEDDCRGSRGPGYEQMRRRGIRHDSFSAIGGSSSILSAASFGCGDSLDLIITVDYVGRAFPGRVQ